MSWSLGKYINILKTVVLHVCLSNLGSSDTRSKKYRAEIGWIHQKVKALSGPAWFLILWFQKNEFSGTLLWCVLEKMVESVAKPSAFYLKQWICQQAWCVNCCDYNGIKAKKNNFHIIMSFSLSLAICLLRAVLGHWLVLNFQFQNYHGILPKTFLNKTKTVCSVSWVQQEHMIMKKRHWENDRKKSSFSQKV